MEFPWLVQGAVTPPSRAPSWAIEDSVIKARSGRGEQDPESQLRLPPSGTLSSLMRWIPISFSIMMHFLNFSSK